VEHERAFGAFLIKMSPLELLNADVDSTVASYLHGGPTKRQKVDHCEITW